MEPMKKKSLWVGPLSLMVLLLLGAWLVMLLIGDAHYFDSRIPTIGYPATVLLLLAARICVGVVTYES